MYEMDDLEEQDENTPKTLVFTDEFWQKKARQFRTNERQTAFVRALVENPGLTRTEAARMAGYSGSDVAMRVQATRAWGSTKIKALYTSCLDGQDLKELDIAGRDEILKWCSDQMRRGVGATQLKAGELLLKFHDGLENKGRTPFVETLTQLCEVALESRNPHLITAAIYAAQASEEKASREWRPPFTALQVLNIYPKILNSLESKHARYLDPSSAPRAKTHGGAASRPRGNGAEPARPVTTSHTP